MLEKAAKVAEMALERQPFYKIKNEVDDIMGSSDDAGAFLDGLQVVYRNLLLEKSNGISLYKDEKLMDSIHSIEKARKQIKEGVAVSYAMKDLLLKIGG